MRILSVSIQNYRIHRQLTVPFADRLTVIGGPNESGKSTLVEAVHRALFMRHKTGGAELDAMRSHFGGHPEVTVTFEVGGESYSIRKVFRGTSGTAVLEQPGKAPVQGDEAEVRLAELLGESAVTRGWSSEKWSHLWVWQAEAFADPSKSANAHAGDLVERFQRDGAAVVQQSTLDAQLAQYFSDRTAELYNKNGSTRKNSPLDVATVAHTEAHRIMQDRTEMVNRLFDAARQLEVTQHSLRELTGSIAVRERELSDTRGTIAQLDGLRNRAALQHKDVEAARTVLDELEGHEGNIRTLRQRVAALREQMAPMQIEAARLVEQEQMARQALADAEQRLTATDDAVRITTARKALAEAYTKRLVLVGLRQELEGRAQHAVEIAEGASQLQRAMALLPAVDEVVCGEIEKGALEAEVAQARVNAIATRIELLRGDTDVRVGGETLSAGTPHVIIDDTELSVGAGVTLRITPGGGASLASAQQQADDARRHLLTLLQQAGVDTKEAARAALTERTGLAARLQVHEQQLVNLRPGELDADRRALEARWVEAEAEIERRVSHGTALAEPTTEQDAALLEAAQRDTLEKREQEQVLLIEQRTQLHLQLERVADARHAHRESMSSQDAELAAADTLLASQLAVRGGDIDRAASLAEARATHRRHTDAIGITTSAIAALEPESIELQLRMLTDGVSALKEQRRTAENTALLANRDLEQDGSHDPHAELALAVAREQEAAARLSRIRRQSEAIRELQDLYATEKQQLAEQFAGPLRERADKYLRIVLPDSGLHLDFDGESLTDVGIVRGTMRTRFDFDTLSTGAREQVATALRLGVAEVLAASHDGALPVVFDDAFAYSDPDRLKRLRLMLYQAAELGLQIIVLSCNAADYDGLGARITLERPIEVTSPVPTGASTRDRRDPQDGVASDDDHPIESAIAIAARGGVVHGGTVREDDARAFMTALRRRGGHSGNQSLREELAWDEEQYAAVRSYLRDTGVVTIGRGRGGSVSLSD